MTDSSDSDSSAARIAFLRGLRAVRQLRPDPLPESVLHDILEVARWSGSAGNRQPWEFVVVRDRDLLRRLSAIDGANASHLASAAAGIAVVIHPEVPDLDAYDEGRLAERILLAAAAQGVGAAIGHFTGPADTWAASAEAKRVLGIPEQFLLRETISLGYPAEHLPRTPNPPGRTPLELLVHWEHYGCLPCSAMKTMCGRRCLTLSGSQRSTRSTCGHKLLAK